MMNQINIILDNITAQWDNKLAVAHQEFRLEEAIVFLHALQAMKEIRTQINTSVLGENEPCQTSSTLNPEATEQAPIEEKKKRRKKKDSND